MHRIKRIEDVIIQPDVVLLEVILKPKKVILLAEETSDYDYLKVVKIGKDVTRYEVGDIVLDIPAQVAHGFKVGEKAYIRIVQNHILVAVKPDNFDKDKKEEVKSTLLS